jgi:hypothetical protein
LSNVFVEPMAHVCNCHFKKPCTLVWDPKAKIAPQTDKIIKQGGFQRLEAGRESERHMQLRKQLLGKALDKVDKAVEVSLDTR